MSGLFIMLAALVLAALALWAHGAKSPGCPKCGCGICNDARIGKSGVPSAVRGTRRGLGDSHAAEN